MESEAANFQAINIGTGRATSVRQIAELLASGLKVQIGPSLVGRFREGDIRHCFADISRARRLLGFEPTVRLEDGIPQLLEWVKRQRATDGVVKATEELQMHGLVR
jgi:dTDP-L-rhamnose 4-epimerase